MASNRLGAALCSWPDLSRTFTGLVLALHARMPSLLAFLLLPFSWLYAAVMAVRNWAYDAGWKKSEAFAVPLLNVGNLRVGGTGKTPHVAWLVEELLRQGHRPAVLSRGYGRRTKGPRLAGPADSAATVGDSIYIFGGYNKAQFDLFFRDFEAAVSRADRTKNVPVYVRRGEVAAIVVIRPTRSPWSRLRCRGTRSRSSQGSRASSWSTCLLTMARVSPSVRAALEKLRKRATSAKISIERS